MEQDVGAFEVEVKDAMIVLQNRIEEELKGDKITIVRKCRPDTAARARRRQK